MSEENRETIDLAYIGRALQRLTNQVAGMQEQMNVQTAVILRHEETLKGILEQITAMVRQNARIVDRLNAVEARVDSLEDSSRP
jgi:hypothetical protein